MAKEEGNELPTAWLIRAGKSGEREDFNLEHGLASCGWGDVPDLRELASRTDVERLLRDAVPSARDKAILTWASQLWSLRERVRVGDLVVMPLKTTSQIAFGVVTQPYWYNVEDDPSWRHVVSVEWKRTDVPRTAVKQDLLHSLGSALTICTITRNDGQRRLHELLESGIDAGARTAGAAKRREGDASSAEQSDDEAAESTESDIDLERIGKDRIQRYIAENFAGHELSRLVAELLTAEG